ncbi:CSEP0399 putative effector protein [Blumeria hordei DH14]|uniref:CSEP0399 putative effector protein n=1 Tax=Blumeria graminis f. sp. hordei (strain DH14) TaxID=546991 RepID=N1JJG3_BLUG1|nr:CSEP0399 putative effector protein [Blumeria hordei DH14]
MKFLSLSIITVVMDLLCVAHSRDGVEVTVQGISEQRIDATNTATARTHEFACMNKVIKGQAAIDAIRRRRATVYTRMDNGVQKKLFYITVFTQDIVSIKYYAEISMHNRFEKVISVMNNLMVMPCEMLARGTTNTINDRNRQSRSEHEYIVVHAVVEHLARQED